MSRLDGRYVDVEQDSLGRPSGFIVGNQSIDVTAWVSHHREWIGVLDGDMQRDVWLIDTDRGVAELHYLSQPKSDDDDDGGVWALFRWED